MEILAPAGSPEALQAALAAGADAVYFGLKRLNARRGAANFAPEDLKSVVETIHAAGAKAYLTLNIDLVQRELGLAMRTLQLASAAGVDAVLLRDPALLAARGAFPALPFHFSTQAAVSSSAGVQAAKALGVSRVVLAREMSAGEIAAAAVPGVELEVFVQGALCFCCSGRCLLSSWGGGRSGNRGACASPCRVLWTDLAGNGGSWLSMHDLCLAGDLAELRRLGVASLKIEGRLKSAAWVRDAVTLYRRALAATEHPEALATDLDQAAQLGAYTGRQMTNGYFTGRRDNLTGDSGRVASRTDTPAATVAAADAVAPPNVADGDDESPRLTLSRDDRGGTLWAISHGFQERCFRIAPQRVAKAKRATSIAAVLEQLATAVAADGATLATVCMDSDLPEILLPRSAGNGVVDDIVSYLRLIRKESDGIVRGVSLPPNLQTLLAARGAAHPANTRHLGDGIDCIRINADQADAFLATNSDQTAPLLLCCSPTAATTVPELFAKISARANRLAAVAMPAVLYEAELPAWRALLPLLAAATVPVEVNSWDGWQLAREAGCVMEAGPGMAVMNSVAAQQLCDLGCRMVTASCELDCEQMEELCGAIAVPMSLTVFAHLPLMLTRAELPAGCRPEDHVILQDKRQTALLPRREGALTVLYGETPLDWRSLRNPKIAAARLVADLRAAPTLRWPQTPGAADGPSRLFNYDRRLR